MKFSSVIVFASFMLLVCTSYGEMTSPNGFKRQHNETEESIIGFVDNFIEDEARLKISISDYNAIYVFPKSSNLTAVKNLLLKSRTEKIKYEWIVNPFNRKIYQIKFATNK